MNLLEIAFKKQMIWLSQILFIQNFWIKWLDKLSCNKLRQILSYSNTIKMQNVFHVQIHIVMKILEQFIS